MTRRATERRIVSGALVLAAAAFGGLAVGALLPPPASAGALAVPALAVQTLLTVGAIPRRERGVALRPGLLLLALHHGLATLPLALVAVALGLDEPLGFGLFLVAVAPPAALTPAYADVAEVEVVDLLVFVLAGYGLALVLTPGLVTLAAGESVGVGAIALTLGAGLIVPSLLARAVHPPVARIPQEVRRGVVNFSVFVISYGLGGEIGEGLGAGGVSVGAMLVVVAALAARAVVGGEVARRLVPAGLRDEAPFAVAFKNLALSAAVGGSLLGPAAALPGLLGFPVETLYFVALARLSARRGSRRTSRGRASARPAPSSGRAPPPDR